MRSRNFVFGLVASLATIALAVGLLFVVDAAADDEIELPDKVGDLVALDTEAAFPGGQPPQAVERRREADDVNAAGFRDAFDGAAADARVYLDPEDADGDVISVVAVAADAGPLLPLEDFVDPEQIGFALPQTELVDDGDVECLVYRVSPPRAGTDYQPDQAEPDAVHCQQHSGSLTVRARSNGGDLATTVAIVTDVWDELD